MQQIYLSGFIIVHPSNNTRTKNKLKKTDPNFLVNYDDKIWIINIPDKYKPLNYMKIENGCYW